ncbi:hypothetical protein [Bhargavaea cecembensis]|uniref:hypothetical protein n=1 Tax=Bhargavaea cecembensis TaxID=394098 RepID=UPI00058B7047|nr:hypothetical protein [Bhargavaea cecembensis]
MNRKDQQPLGNEPDAYTEDKSFAGRHPEFEREIDDSVIPSEAVIEESVGQRGFFDEGDREAAEEEGRLQEKGEVMEGTAGREDNATGVAVTGGDRDVYRHERDADNGDDDVVGIEDGTVNSRGVERRPDEGSVSIGADYRELKDEELVRGPDNAASEGRLPPEMAEEEEPFSGVQSGAADPNLGPAPFGEPAVDEIDRSPARDHIDARHRERFM